MLISKRCPTTTSKCYTEITPFQKHLLWYGNFMCHWEQTWKPPVSKRKKVIYWAKTVVFWFRRTKFPLKQCAKWMISRYPGRNEKSKPRWISDQKTKKYQWIWTPLIFENKILPLKKRICPNKSVIQQLPSLRIRHWGAWEWLQLHILEEHRTMWSTVPSILSPLKPYLAP